MLERLHLEWPPGEPFYSVVEAEITRLRARFADACGLLARMQTHLDSTGLAKLGESYVDTVLPRLIAKYDELRAEVAGLKDAYDIMKNVADQRHAEMERVRSNHVTVAEEIQRRHDACAPLTAEIDRLRGFLKHLKGEAQDRDDLKLMDEIDDVLSDKSKE